MSKFKVGDKVRLGVDEYSVRDKRELVGHTDVIKEVLERANDYKYLLTNDKYLVWSDDELTLVEDERPTPKFKVGDRVKVTTLTNKSTRKKKQFLGQTFTIRAVRGTSKYPYAFVEPNGFFWKDDELEAIPDIKEHTVVIDVQFTWIGTGESTDVCSTVELANRMKKRLSTITEFDDILIKHIKVFERDLV